MTQLAKLQQIFQDCVLHPDKIASTAWVSARGRAAPETQLSIYTHAYTARLKEVLANDYPALLMAMGEEQFNSLADEYIQAYPSHYFSLRDFGCHLPDYIAEKTQRKTNGQVIHMLHELALFEWTLGQAFDAANARCLNVQDMAAILPDAWPELRFVIHPSVHRLDLEWNIPEMWQVLTSDKPSQVTAVCDTASPWLIWREQLITRFRSMPIEEKLALDALRRGESFNDMCDLLATCMNEEAVPLHAASLLKGWIAQELICDIQ